MHGNHRRERYSSDGSAGTKLWVAGDSALVNGAELRNAHQNIVTMKDQRIGEVAWDQGNDEGIMLS